MSITGSVFSLRDVVNEFDEQIRPNSLAQAKTTLFAPDLKSSLSSFSGSGTPTVISATLKLESANFPTLSLLLETSDNTQALVQYRSRYNTGSFYTSSTMFLSPSSSVFELNLYDLTGSVGDYEFKLVNFNGFNSTVQNQINTWQESGSVISISSFSSTPSLTDLTSIQYNYTYDSNSNYPGFVQTDLSQLKAINLKYYVSLLGLASSLNKITLDPKDPRKEQFRNLKVYIPKDREFNTAEYFVVASTIEGNRILSDTEKQDVIPNDFLYLFEQSNSTYIHAAVKTQTKEILGVSQTFFLLLKDQTVVSDDIVPTKMVHVFPDRWIDGIGSSSGGTRSVSSFYPSTGNQNEKDKMFSSLVLDRKSGRVESLPYFTFSTGEVGSNFGSYLGYRADPTDFFLLEFSQGKPNYVVDTTGFQLNFDHVTNTADRADYTQNYKVEKIFGFGNKNNIDLNQKTCDTLNKITWATGGQNLEQLEYTDPLESKPAFSLGDNFGVDCLTLADTLKVYSEQWNNHKLCKFSSSKPSIDGTINPSRIPRTKSKYFFVDFVQNSDTLYELLIVNRKNFITPGFSFSNDKFKKAPLSTLCKAVNLNNKFIYSFLKAGTFSSISSGPISLPNNVNRPISCNPCTLSDSELDKIDKTKKIDVYLGKYHLYKDRSRTVGYVNGDICVEPSSFANPSTKKISVYINESETFETARLFYGDVKTFKNEQNIFISGALGTLVFVLQTSGSAENNKVVYVGNIQNTSNFYKIGEVGTCIAPPSHPYPHTNFPIPPDDEKPTPNYPYIPGSQIFHSGDDCCLFINEKES